jgi:flagellar protein FlbD
MELSMILLTRLNGSQVGINPDLLERLEHNPDTVLCLIDGTRYVVSETLDEVVGAIIEFRARVLSATDQLTEQAGMAAGRREGPERKGLRLVVDSVEDTSTGSGG